jgi:hypothetical protein
MYMDKSRWKFWSFIALAFITTIILLIACFVYVPLATEGMENPWNPTEWKQTFIDRAPFIVQSVLNLLLFLTICVCGAVLYSSRMKNARKGFLIIGIMSCMSAFLLHSMVYGVDILLPSPYSLLAPYHRPLILLGIIQTSIFFQNIVLNHLFSIIVHIFAPQVLLGVFVSILAIRKYKGKSTSF